MTKTHPYETFPLTHEEKVSLTTYEEIAEKWDMEYANPRWKGPDWSIFTEGMPVDAWILDLGCGTAAQTASLVIPEGFRYFGIDISEKMIAAARKNLQGKPLITAESLQIMDMRNLHFDDGSFHGFTCITSFMHLPRKTLSLAISEARRVLKPKGKGLISISRGDFEGLWAPREVSQQAYVVCWQRTELNNLFTKGGFSILFEEELEHMLIYVIQKNEILL